MDTFNGLDTDRTATPSSASGLMLFTESGGADKAAGHGGYVRAAIRDMNAANQAKYAALINSFDKNNDKSNGGKAGKTMAEAYQYFSGLPPHGRPEVQDRLHEQRVGTAQSKAVYALPGNALRVSTVALQQPGPGGQLRRQLHHLHQQRAVQDNSADNTRPPPG